MKYNKNVVKLTKDDLLICNLENYGSSLYKETLFSNLLGVERYTKGTRIRVYFECGCGSYFKIPLSTAYENIKQKNIISCGCVEEREKAQLVESLLKIYHTKLPKSEDNPYFCKYCESFRSELSKSGMSEYCSNCKILIKNHVQIGKTFENVMAEWCSDTDSEEYKILPILKGNYRKGFNVIGSTIIDARFYEELCKMLWITDSNDYPQTSMSKENLKRIDKNHICYSESARQVKLHRVILGINNITHKDVVGDHVNGDKRDNRLCNLRRSTHLENSINSRKFKNCKSEYIGVSQDNRTANLQWRARLHIGTTSKSKFFSCEEEAAKGYDDLLRQYRPSEFNVYNFPEINERGKDGKIRVV